MTFSWKKIGGTASIFVAGADFERLCDGDVDTFFGTHWLLAVFIVCCLFTGMVALQALPARATM